MEASQSRTDERRGRIWRTTRRWATLRKRTSDRRTDSGPCLETCCPLASPSHGEVFPARGADRGSRRTVELSRGENQRVKWRGGIVRIPWGTRRTTEGVFRDAATRGTLGKVVGRRTAGPLYPPSYDFKVESKPSKISRFFYFIYFFLYTYEVDCRCFMLWSGCSIPQFLVSLSSYS